MGFLVLIYSIPNFSIVCTNMLQSTYLKSLRTLSIHRGVFILLWNFLYVSIASSIIIIPLTSSSFVLVINIDLYGVSLGFILPQSGWVESSNPYWSFFLTISNISPYV